MQILTYRGLSLTCALLALSSCKTGGSASLSSDESYCGVSESEIQKKDAEIATATDELKKMQTEADKPHQGVLGMPTRPKLSTVASKTWNQHIKQRCDLETSNAFNHCATGVKNLKGDATPADEIRKECSPYAAQTSRTCFNDYSSEAQAITAATKQKEKLDGLSMERTVLSSTFESCKAEANRPEVVEPVKPVCDGQTVMDLYPKGYPNGPLAGQKPNPDHPRRMSPVDNVCRDYDCPSIAYYTTKEGQCYFEPFAAQAIRDGWTNKCPDKQIWFNNKCVAADFGDTDKDTVLNFRDLCAGSDKAMDKSKPLTAQLNVTGDFAGCVTGQIRDQDKGKKK